MDSVDPMVVGHDSVGSNASGVSGKKRSRAEHMLAACVRQPAEQQRTDEDDNDRGSSHTGSQAIRGGAAVIGMSDARAVPARSRSRSKRDYRGSVSISRPRGKVKISTKSGWGGEREERPHIRWGNFDPHEGYLVGGGGEGIADSRVWRDNRLGVLEPAWFSDAHVLDIGCGAGYFTILAAQQYPSIKSLLGVDIDNRVPMSVATVQGCIPTPGAGVAATWSTGEPLTRVHFRREDFVGNDDLGHLPNFYDVIICFNVTKWIHLNYGDRGLCTLLRKAHHLLKDGGKLLLLAQPWPSYARSSTLTPEMTTNYKSLKMKPSEILRYLLDRVGFRRLLAVRNVLKPLTNQRRQLLVLEK